MDLIGAEDPADVTMALNNAAEHFRRRARSESMLGDLEQARRWHAVVAALREAELTIDRTLHSGRSSMGLRRRNPRRY